MYSQRDFKKHVGKWTTFNTPWGTHRGMIEGVRNDWVLFKLPSKSVPSWVKTRSKPGNKPDIMLSNYFKAYDGCALQHVYFPCWGGGLWFWCWIPIVFILFFSCFCW